MHLAKKKRTKTPVRRLLMATGIAAASGVAASAQTTFESNFNDGIPAGMVLYGNALSYDHTTGGVDNSGVLKIVNAVGSQQSSAIIEDFDFGNLVAGFDATFKMRIGGGTATPADGVSFVWGTGIANASWPEEGPTIQGLTVVFDIYNNGSNEAPAIDLKWNGTEIA